MCTSEVADLVALDDVLGKNVHAIIGMLGENSTVPDETREHWRHATQKLFMQVDVRTYVSAESGTSTSGQ